jgi:hypothetical protein
MSETVPWFAVREMMQNFPRSQLPELRALDDDELMLLQCMTFIPLAKEFDELSSDEDDIFANLEQKYFVPSTKDLRQKRGLKRIKYRLLRECVRDEVNISRETFMQVTTVLQKLLSRFKNMNYD